MAPEDKVASTPNPAKPRDPTPDELKVEFAEDPEITAPADEPQEIKPAEPKSVEVKKVEFEARVPVKVEAKKEEEKKEEKKDDTKAKDEPDKITPLVPKSAQPKEEVKPIVPASAQPKERDYTGFTPEEKAALKAMSNEAFNFVAPRLKAAREMERNKDSQFYQHPNGYLLDPEFHKLQEDISYYKKEGEYWQEQLVAIGEGKDWTPVVGWNKDGSPALGQPQKPTKMAEEQVRMAMNQCYGAAQKAVQDAQGYPVKYQQRVQQDNSAIQEECARRFGWCADPKILDATVDIGNGVEKSIKDIRQDLLDLLPPYQRGNIVADVAAHLWAALQIYGQEIRELRNGKRVAEIKKEEVTRAEPTSNNRPAPEGEQVGGVKTFSLDGLPE